MKNLPVNKVYSYYSHVLDRNDYELIGLCAESWKQNGWEFELLGPSLAWQSKFYYNFMHQMRQRPTVNNQAYELSCYERWLAMQHIGGGILIDYDMINAGFQPIHLPEGDCFLGGPGYAPVSLNRMAYIDIILRMIEARDTVQINGQDHSSDMILLQYNQNFGYPTYPISANYGTEGWEQAKIIHYATSSIGGVYAEKVPLIKKIHNL